MALTSEKKYDAFTLIELLVVIAIISLLVSILLPSLTKAKELARRAICATNLHSVYLGLNMYASDYDGSYPENTDVTTYKIQRYMVRHWESPDISAAGTGFIETYLENPQMLYCPSWPYSDWPETNRIGSSGSNNLNTVSYAVFSWLFTWADDPATRVVYSYTASGVHSEPDTFIMMDMIFSYSACPWIKANHPPQPRNDIFGDGGNVLYNDGSVIWKSTENFDGVYRLFWYYPTQR